MKVIAREAAGREWVYQLREWVADLNAEGRPGRARELARLAAVTEREIELLHAEALVHRLAATSTDGLGLAV